MKKVKYSVAWVLVQLLNRFKERPMTKSEIQSSIQNVNAVRVLYSYGYTQKDIGKFLTDLALIDTGIAKHSFRSFSIH